MAMTEEDFNPLAASDHLLVFDVVRREDATGTSGTGIVAKGVVFPDGTTVIQWQSHIRSVAVYSSYGDALHLHGHKDLTGFCFQARPDRLYLSSGEWVWLAEQPLAEEVSDDVPPPRIEFYD